MDFKTLENYLRGKEEDEFELSYVDIESITGPISPSYINLKHFKRGYAFEQHVNNAGFEITKCDYDNRIITFKRNTSLVVVTAKKRAKKAKATKSSPLAPFISWSNLESYYREFDSAATFSSGLESTINECDDRFRNARNVKLTDEKLKSMTFDDLLKESVKKSFGAAMGAKAYYAKKLVPLKAPTASAKADAIEYLIRELKEKINYVNTTGTLWDDVKYREWHKEVCEKLINIFRTHIGVTSQWEYGNSQKVLNLSIKYIYEISKRLRDLESSPSYLIKINTFLTIKDKYDIPIDRYIIYGILFWNYHIPSKKILLPELSSTSPIPKTTEYSWKKWVDDNYCKHIKRWYDWDYNDYKQFVDDFHRYISKPMEYEAITWTIINSLFK